MVKVNIVGAGLAGCEAAYQLSKRGIQVRLYEMRSQKMTPAHKTGLMAELVCSNSFRSDSVENAVGLLKEELKELDSLLMFAARKTSVPAGKALAVDRKKFSQMVTEYIKNDENIEVMIEEVTSISDKYPIIIASGPLTSSYLTNTIIEFTGENNLYFFDAAAPIICGESIDMSRVFWGSRYADGEGGDYLNCPMTKEEYNKFYENLLSSETFELRSFEREIYFEGCMPIEELARRGYNTLLYGPFKPVGLIDPNTKKQPFAVVQLRREDSPGSLFNIVGFQTSLKRGEQQKIIHMIPGLENSEIIRYGAIHRNTYICSPKILNKTLQARKNPYVFFAGQITGAEGYVESISTGLVSGINCARLVQGKEPLIFPEETSIGALCNYISTTAANKFRPMNINFGLFPPLSQRYKRKKEARQKTAERGLKKLYEFLEQNEA